MLDSIHKIIRTGIGSGIGILSAVISIATPSLSQFYVLAQGVSLPPNIIKLLDDFGLTAANCSDETANISIGSRTVCVQPTTKIKSGNYYRYDPETDTIKPLSNPNQRTFESQYQFNFTNLSDYDNCLSDVIRFYQNPEIFWQQGRLSDCVDDIFQANATNGLTKEQALAIIEAADKYATQLLSPPLYPLYGIRKKINKEFGFVYKIDMQQ